MKQTEERWSRLLVRVIDNSKPIETNEQGIRMAHTKWQEVGSITLGSKKNPNREVIEFRFEPIQFEDKEPAQIDLNKFFKSFGLDL